jgi:hypothetical protein
MTTYSATATTPMVSEMRVPYSMRASTSRPSVSVPNGCRALGASRLRDGSVSR